MVQGGAGTRDVCPKRTPRQLRGAFAMGPELPAHAKGDAGPDGGRRAAHSGGAAEGGQGGGGAGGATHCGW